MRQDHEELVLRNPALGATAFWHFSGQFGDRAKGVPPVLPYFFIAMAILHHRASVDKLWPRKQRNSASVSPISKASSIRYSVRSGRPTSPNTSRPILSASSNTWALMVPMECPS